MNTELHEDCAEVNGQLYEIQAILAVNPDHPRWCTVGWNFFQKDEKLFINTDPGRELVEKLELVRYLGGRFTDGPTFHTLANAQEFLRVVKEGGWDDGGTETRIVLHEWHESIRVMTADMIRVVELEAEIERLNKEL